MKKHTKIIMEYFGYTEADFIPCTLCEKKARDTHHINTRGMGGRKTFQRDGKTYQIDAIENLIFLCRECHEQAHKGEISRDILWHGQKLKMRNIKNWRYE